MKLLEKAGTYSLGLGIESGSEKILKTMKKMQTIEEIREKVNLIHRITKIRMTGKGLEECFFKLKCGVYIGC